jgi:hypothetical protein
VTVLPVGFSAAGVDHGFVPLMAELGPYFVVGCFKHCALPELAFNL